MEKLEYNRYNARIKYEWVVICFIILTDLTKVLLSFVWLMFSSFGWDHAGWRNKEWQEPKLGDAHGTLR